MIKVLFVCLGNICRSPLAEGVFKAMLVEKGHYPSIICDSAGTAGYHIGASPDRRSIQIAKNHNITLDHAGRKLSSEDFDEFDFILAMDENNYKDIEMLQRRSKNTRAKVIMFRDFDPLGKGDVPDPYHGVMQDFEEVFDICERTSEALLQFLLKEIDG